MTCSRYVSPATRSPPYAPASVFLVLLPPALLTPDFSLVCVFLVFVLWQMLSYRYERRKSHSDVQRLVLNRYFTYQVRRALR